MPANSSDARSPAVRCWVRSSARDCRVSACRDDWWDSGTPYATQRAMVTRVASGGYEAFFAGVEALVIGRGTYDTVLGFPSWLYGRKRVIVCTSRPATPAHGEELWSGPPRALADRLDRDGVRRVYLDGGALIGGFLREGLVD